MSETAAASIEAIYRRESRAVLATLIRLLGDFDSAEEALHEAFRAALERWPREGLPDNPRAWLVSAGRFKAIDARRRNARFDAFDEDRHDIGGTDDPSADPDSVEDDRLRLVFTCCHPALSADAQVALTLREVCGLATEDIAAAFLTPAPTLAQRIVRAKAKIRDAGIPPFAAGCRSIQVLGLNLESRHGRKNPPASSRGPSTRRAVLRGHSGWGFFVHGVCATG